MNLYVSDLDGTLLNSNKEVSEYSKEILNRFMNGGGKFTVATARTPGTVIDLLEELDINLPVILMNGVILYDIKQERYLKVKNIDINVVKEILNIISTYNKNAFLYSIEDDKLNVYYKNLKLNFDKNYYLERAKSKYKKFKEVKDYNEVLQKGLIINIVVMDEMEVIKSIYNKIKNIKGIYSNYSEDIYTSGCYFLEIHSDLASKANGIKEISNIVPHDELICFGDNTNDISMFNLADRACAMGNAVEALKNIATDIIDDNNKDGVAKFIKNENKL